MPRYKFIIEVSGYAQSKDDIPVLQGLARTRTREIMAAVSLLPKFPGNVDPSAELKFKWDTNPLANLEWEDKGVRPGIHYMRQRFDNDMYWSNEFGWVDFSEADEYSAEEAKELRPPMDGEWYPPLNVKREEEEEDPFADIS